MGNAAAITIDKNAKTYIKTWQLFIIITAVSLLISFAFQKLIMTKDVFYNLYGSQMEEYRIDDFIKMIQKFQVWGYIAMPLIIWLRIAIVSFLIQLPFLIMFKEISFQRIFRIVTIAYFVFMSADIIRFFYLYLQPSDKITLDLLNFMPLALTNFLDKNGYSDLSFSFLSKINIFEFIWGVVIYFKLKETKILENIDYVLIVFGVWIATIALTYGTFWFIGVIS